MEPRQGGRFHIWHMLTSKMPFCNLCARERRYFRGENCALRRYAPWLRARKYLPATLVSLTTNKNPGRKGRGSKSMAVEPTNDSANQKNKYKCGNRCTKSRKENNVIHRHKYKLFMQMLK